MEKKEKEEKKTKRPTALKRDIQSEKRRLINKSFKSEVRTVLRLFDESLTSKDAEKIKTSLSAAESVMDKGVKRGIYKVNKASRTKARLKARTTQTAK